MPLPQLVHTSRLTEVVNFFYLHFIRICQLSENNGILCCTNMGLDFDTIYMYRNPGEGREKPKLVNYRY